MNKSSWITGFSLALCMQLQPGAAGSPDPTCKTYDLSPEHASVTLEGVMFKIANLGDRAVVLVTSSDPTPIMFVPPLSPKVTMFVGDENYTYIAKLETPYGKTTIMVC